MPAAHRVELLPTSPTFLNLLLLSEEHQRHDLSSLKLITYGTEPMPAHTLQKVHALFPEVKLLQTYGLSELGILRSQSRESGSLWMRVGGEGFETKIVDGRLFIRASSAMLGYLNAPNPFDADGFFDPATSRRSRRGLRSSDARARSSTRRQHGFPLESKTRCSTPQLETWRSRERTRSRPGCRRASV